MEILKIILYIFIFIYATVYVLVFHKMLIKWAPYRWVCESIAYRFNLRKIKRLSHDDKIELYTTILIYDFWHQTCWFGRGIKRYLEKYIDRTEIS